VPVSCNHAIRCSFIAADDAEMTDIMVIIIWLLARFQSNGGFTFSAHFGVVLAFGYNSAETEPIWMKSGAL